MKSRSGSIVQADTAALIALVEVGVIAKVIMWKTKFRTNQAMKTKSKW